MKNSGIKIIVLMLLFAGIKTQAQLIDSSALATKHKYTDLAEALKNPDKVYKLDLHRKKLKKVPAELFTLVNLQQLNLSRNKLKELPKDIGKLTNLQILDVSSNDIDTLYPEIGQLVNLKKLILNQNIINYLPSTIGNLTKLYFLDMWGNNIQKFPKEIKKLKNTLKTIDLRVISINDDDQEEMVNMLPYTKILFSTSCHCN